jgi:hypothetical protein
VERLGRLYGQEVDARELKAPEEARTVGRCVVAGPEGGRRPPAGPALKFVEKLLTASLTGTDRTERNASKWSARVPLVASLVELATGPGFASSWSSLSLPAEAPLSSSPTSRPANLALTAYPCGFPSNWHTVSWDQG